MTQFKNLYALLGIKINASKEQIQAAMLSAAQQQTLSLSDLQLCRKYLLAEDKRILYDDYLKKHHPDVLKQATDPSLSDIPEKKPAENEDGIRYGHLSYNYSTDIDKKSSIAKLVLFTVFIIFVAIIGASFTRLMQGYGQYVTREVDLRKNIPEIAGYATIKKYHQIQLGMTLQQVTEIMGSRGQPVDMDMANLSESEALYHRQWSALNGSGKINIEFRDGRVSAKSEDHLN